MEIEKHIFIVLTQWNQVTHICISELTIIASGNGLLPGRHPAITWINTGILLIWTLGTNSSEISGEIHTFPSLENVIFEMAALLSRPQNVKENAIQIA